MNVKLKIPYLLLTITMIVVLSCSDGANSRYDLVVYGGTSAGVVAAVQGARMGASVALIEPGEYLGGMSSGGLGQTDKGHEQTIGGLSRRFYHTVGKLYGKQIAWKFEPHKAKQAFEMMVAEAGPGNIEVFRGEKLLLDPDSGVVKEGDRIRRIVMESGRRFSGESFIDATYEGDLMAMSGVSYVIGRESRDTYGESLAGVLDPGEGEFYQPKQFFPKDMSPYVVPGDPSSGLLPGIQDTMLPPPGTGDKKTQAYNFRVCLTSDPENRIPIEKPGDYDSMRYELLARWIQAWPDIELRWHHGNHGIFIISPMPNNKTDINDGCPASTDYIGANWDYPEAGHEERERIVQDHESYTKGLLWFVQNDPRVPEHIREEFGKYGYPKDEYVDNGHFSHQLYIREARRMVGPYVMTQQDCRRDHTKPDPVGLGSYGVDSHHVQRVLLDGRVVNEGNFLAKHMSYEIPYRSIIPKAGECANLLVPVCLSSSHIAFGSIRMEPVFMILGQSAATAALMAQRQEVSVQELAYEDLRERLLADGQVLDLEQPRARKRQ
jgi:hypothetical protein